MQLLNLKGYMPGKRNGWGVVASLFAFVLVMVLALVASPAAAQYGASLQGTVADAQGSLIPGAHLTLTEKETGRTATANTDGSGNFFFGGLAPNIYKIEITHDGFKTKVIDNLKIIADQANGAAIKLEVGGASTTVIVNAADQPLIDTETGNLGATISQQEISKLPSFGRDVFQLVQLAPGMFGDGAQQSGGGTSSLPGSQSSGSGNSAGIFQTENQPQTSAAGGRTDTNSITLDGVSITSVTWGGAAVITPNEDTIKEFKVVSNPYDAEDGRTSGASIKMTSQNGTNVIHGTAFFKFDRPGLNAAPRWDPNGNPLGDKDVQKFNQMGGTVGGPILHNKLFGFFGYETIRNSSNPHNGGWYETSTIDTLATSNSQSIASKFTTIKDKGNDPVFIKQQDQTCAQVNLVQGYNCNMIQGQGLAVGTQLSSGLGSLGTQDPSFFGTETASGPGGADYYAQGLGGNGNVIVNPWMPISPKTGLTQYIADPGTDGANLGDTAALQYLITSNPTKNINTQYNARVDYQATSKDLIAVSAYYTPVNNTSYNGASRAYNLFHHNAKNYSFGALYDHTFSSNFINQARADMAGWKWNEIKDNSQEPLGLPDANITSASFGNTEGSISPATFGPSLGSEFDQWTLNFKDVATWAHKTHNIKFGGNVTRLAYLDLPDWQAQPNFSFNNIWDFLNDAPNSESVTSDPRTGVPTAFRKDDRQMVYGFFVQDDWKVKPNLTINAGIRWEYFPGMTEKNGTQPNLRLGSGADILTGMNIQLNSSEVNAQKGNFGPQIGFAWSPKRDNGKLVVHGGFGIGFNGLEMAVFTNNRFNPPFAYNAPNLPTAAAAGAGAPHLYYQTATNLYSTFQFPANTSVITPFNSANLPTNGANSVTGFPTDYATPYVYRYSLDAQYDLGHQWVATLGYQGSIGRHLPVDYNLLDRLAPQIISGAIAVNPLVNGVNWNAPEGVSSFNALLAEIRHQMTHGFELDAQYRWSKALDDGSQSNASIDYQYLTGYNYGPSGLDSRQMLKVYGLWSPTIFKNQNSLGEKLLGNWNLSGIMNFHSGFPFNPEYSGIACQAFFSIPSGCGGGGNGGNSNLRPSAYTGHAKHSQSTDVFKSGNGNFTGGGSVYFTEPTVTTGPVWNSNAGPQGTFGSIPQAPGIGRNAFVGPHYFDIDLAATKAFVLPKMKILGDNARLELRANAFNVFNKLNLSNNGLDTSIGDGTFGRITGSNGVLGGRTVEAEAHFKF